MTKNIMTQLIKFGVVGVIATIIDFGLLALLTEVCGVHYLTSAAIAFIVATIFNYLASMKYVFKSRYSENERMVERTIFVTLSLVGLVLNQFLLWLFVEYFSVFYIFSKILATILVMTWNFLSRKKWIE